MVKGEEAVSEALGALLLLSLTIIGVMIVFTVVISQVHVEQLPSAELVVIDNETAGIHSLEIVHNGGDTLPFSGIEILVNGMNVTCQGKIDGKGFCTLSQGLSIGEKLTFSPLASVDNLAILYNTSGLGETQMLYTEKFVVVKK